MAETRTVHDPFLGKDVQVSDRLVDRLRGRYASGPHLPNGNPEFGWRQFQAPPIQHEAAAEIERLTELAKLQDQETTLTQVEADMRLAIRAWLKCSAENRPSPAALGQRIADIAAALSSRDAVGPSRQPQGSEQ